ncbi:MAG: hydroxymethylglutaryl-CoA lyase [Fimbriimonadaceae bacterium]|nr:hydroxymethylglutaryl-CoA lyase [Fimbriimonadaceae bacterium]
MIRIIEVGPRDGLQNEKLPIPTEAKLEFIRRLAEAGLREIEATSFVSPKWVPQLGDAAELWPQLPAGPLYSALVPNVKGLERALEVGVGRIAVFTAASDAFTQKNINMTVEESLAAFAEVVEAFHTAGVPPASRIGQGSGPGLPSPAPDCSQIPQGQRGGGEGLGERSRESLTQPDAGGTPAVQGAGFVRGYVSTAFECPYAGRIEPEQVVRVAQRLLALGVDEISIGDTIGVASPREVARLTPMLLDIMPSEQLVYHFHDTRGTAVANVAQALEHGVRAFDSSAAGLGGCPYAKGAGGNLATEDLVYFLEREGIATGVDLTALARASRPILEALGRPPQAKAQVAALASSDTP